jgi:putative PIN family toxin of toxin-antitoxin system
VADTDVIVAAMRSLADASAAILRAVRREKVQLLLSVPLAMEYEAVCLRPEHQLAAGLSEQEAHTFVDAVIASAEPVKIHFLRRPQLRDPGDEMVLEAAVNGRADLLITFNQRDYGTVPEQFGNPSDDTAPGDGKGREMTETSIYPLRRPRSLKKAVDKQSEEDGTSINQFVATAVAEKLSALQVAEFFEDRKARADFKAFDKIMKRRSRGKPPRTGDEMPR